MSAIAEAYFRFGLSLGLSFQIRDDLLGIWGLASETGKATADDLRRKKKSLPVLELYGRVTDDDRQRLDRSTSRLSSTNRPAVEVLQLLEHYGVRSEIERQIERHHDTAIQSLAVSTRFWQWIGGWACPSGTDRNAAHPRSLTSSGSGARDAIDRGIRRARLFGHSIGEHPNQASEVSMDVDFTIIDKMKDEGILKEGHFVHRSGHHTAGLLDRDLLLADPALASHFGYVIAKAFFTERVETVVTPSIWGAGLAQWIGYFLDPKAKVVDVTPVQNDFIIAEKVRSLIEGKRVLLVDNLILSGQTMNHLAEVVESMDATIIGVATLWDSGPDSIHGLDVVSLLNPRYPAYSADGCPLCAVGTVPFEQVPY